VASHNKM